MNNFLRAALASCALLFATTTRLPAPLAGETAVCAVSAAACSSIESATQLHVARASVSTGLEHIARERLRTPATPHYRRAGNSPVRSHAAASAALVRHTSTLRLSFAAELSDAASAHSSSPSTGPPAILRA